jgi:hypothetical protein
VVQRIQEDRPASERDLLRLAVDARDTGLLSREELRGEVAQSGDDLRLDELDLAEEMRLAGLDLVRHRIAVARWPAFQDVRHEDQVPAEPDAGEKLVEELPRLADERESLLVLVEARGLADEHQVRVRVPVPEDDLRPAFREAAARAAGDLGRVGV